MATPPRMAEAEQPLPRCSTIWLSSPTGGRRSSAAACETKWCEVPWKP